jgi:hypothetical protein
MELYLHSPYAHMVWCLIKHQTLPLLTLQISMALECKYFQKLSSIICMTDVNTQNIAQTGFPCELDINFD